MLLLKEESSSANLSHLVQKKMISLKKTQKVVFSTLVTALRHMNGSKRPEGTSVEVVMMWPHDKSASAYAVKTILRNIAAKRFESIRPKEKKTNCLEAKDETRSSTKAKSSKRSEPLFSPSTKKRITEQGGEKDIDNILRQTPSSAVNKTPKRYY